MARAILFLLHESHFGRFHVTNAGSCSWHEFAQKGLALAGIDAPVAAISAAELGLAARRPAYSVLDTSRYRELGMAALRPWPDALAASLSA